MYTKCNYSIRPKGLDFCATAVSAAGGVWGLPSFSASPCYSSAARLLIAADGRLLDSFTVYRPTACIIGRRSHLTVDRE